MLAATPFREGGERATHRWVREAGPIRGDVALTSTSARSQSGWKLRDEVTSRVYCVSVSSLLRWRGPGGLRSLPDGRGSEDIRWLTRAVLCSTFHAASRVHGALS